MLWLLFLINTPEKNTHVRREDKKHETNVNVEHKRKAKGVNIEKSELEERYQDIIVTIKKSRRQKRKMKYMTQEITPKEEARSAAAKQITNGVV